MTPKNKGTSPEIALDDEHIGVVNRSGFELIFTSSENSEDKERERAEEAATLESWEKFFEALFKINYLPEASPQVMPEKAKAEKFIRSVLANYTYEANEHMLVLHNERSDILVGQKAITYHSRELPSGKKKRFDLESAMVMATLASQNPLMIEKGIRLNGTDAQIKLLRKAIQNVNKTLPEGGQLRILNDSESKLSKIFSPKNSASQRNVVDPQPQPVAANPAEENSVPGEVLEPVPETKKAADENAPPEQRAASSEAAIIQPVPEQALQDSAPAPQAVENPVAAPASVTPRKGLFGRMIEALKPQPIPFNPDRRLKVLGATALVATAAVGMTPDAANAADLIQEAPDRRDPLSRWFDSLRGKKPEPEKVKAGHKAKKGEKAKPKKETRKQKAERLKKEQAAAKKETRREKAERLKREKAEQAKERPETKAEKAKRLKREKQEAKEASDTKRQAFVGAATVRLVCVHTGASTTLDLSKPRACQREFNRVTKDWRENVSGDMAPGLITLLERVTKDLRSRGHKVTEIEVIAGFRTEATNNMLIARSKKRNKGKSGVAQNSYHKRGMALDFKIAGVSMAKLRNSAKRAGAWSYSAGDFVHMDTRGAYRI